MIYPLLTLADSVDEGRTSDHVIHSLPIKNQTHIHFFMNKYPLKTTYKFNHSILSILSHSVTIKKMNSLSSFKIFNVF